MLQVSLKRKVSALLGKRHLSPTTQVSNEWSRIEWWRRMFLPADFTSQALLYRVENLECRKFATEYLSLKESQRFATVKVNEARKYQRDLHFRPQEFKNQRITFIENEEKLKCKRCKGKGRIDCSPEVPCPSCRGRRTRTQFCFSCAGRGRAGQDSQEQCWACRGRGTRSDDCATCAGVFSGSTGRVRCNRCGGSGWVVCRSCAGAGEKVRAKLIIRNYTCSTEYHFRLDGLGTDQFRNGLAPKHFKSMLGDLVHQGFDKPSSATVLLQRLSAFSYAVESKTYRYKGADFYLNRISSGNGDKFVTKDLPWSKPKLALVGFLGTFAVCTIPVLSLLS